ncbi:folate-sensitive fragile site protein Fra10Ac1-domain-containing protein [Phanerochaete sordida]|uniref:Folate-sensitive fragile site protein Fra10Ac1-domain-containing protein n=1 Tax=Phanerochaete sordida TaxID=48140 RepID=A0A9P3LD37_9APHY|nr:folate-sensitive fragile site protein Fra10Ac1-domain-containing protein [Phanerochaete sordida]
MSLYRSAGASTSTSLPALTEFDILKEKHKFLRDDTAEDERTWEDKLARKYYDTLYREYAVCDLKHYKSGNFALRWRTEEEVISGAGESTCGNTRCPLHPPRNIDPDDPSPPLKTLELPFAYIEDGQTKSALVKVVLCDKCCDKLMWKRNKEKARQKGSSEGIAQSEGRDIRSRMEPGAMPDNRVDSEHDRRRRKRSPARERARANRSRSRSPRRGANKDGRPRSPGTSR